MKKNVFLFSFLFALLSIQAQIANPSFEDWESPLLSNNYTVTVNFSGLTFFVCGNFTYNEAQNWSSTNQLTGGADFGAIELVTQSSDAFVGTKSIKIESKSLTITPHFTGCGGLVPQTLDNVAPGLIVNGAFELDPQELVDEILGGTGLNALNPFTYPGVGEPINFIPKKIKGHYKYVGGTNTTTGNPDSCIIVSGLKKNGELIGHIVQRFGNAASWTAFEIDYTHLSCEVPDTIITLISSSSIDLEIVNNEFVINSDFTGADGSAMFVDGITFDTMQLADFPPLLANDEAEIFVNEDISIAVLANDEFCDMGVYAPIVLINALNGTTSITASNEILYTPDVNYTGTELITYYICNTAGNCDTAIITIDVLPVPICYANDDTRTLNMNATDYFDPRANDVDCGTNVTLTMLPSNGVAVVESNNFITYSPNTDYSGTDQFKYSICSIENPLQCDTATVFLSIISGINEIAAEKITIYPNPAKNTLMVAVDVEERIFLNLFNTLGQTIISNDFNHSIILDLNTLNNGLYFLSIEANNKKSIQKIEISK
jgi:hypothetical protein